MKSILPLLVLWSIATSLTAAESTNPPLFELRLVLDQATPDSEQMTQIRQTREGKESPEILNVARGALLGHSDVKLARFQKDPITEGPQVAITFTEQGQKTFAEVTRTNLNRRLAILIDGKVISAPVIRTEIRDGKAVIDGNFTKEEATELVNRINKAVQRP